MAYALYIFNHLWGGGGVKSVSTGDGELQGAKLLRFLAQLRPRIRPHKLNKGPTLKEACMRTYH